MRNKKEYVVVVKAEDNKDFKSGDWLRVVPTTKEAGRNIRATVRGFNDVFEVTACNGRKVRVPMFIKGDEILVP